MQKEAERQQEKVVRDNEKAKGVIMALSRAHSSGSCSRSDSDSCTSKGTTDVKAEFHNQSEHCLL